jgi:hypothetical protein
VSGVVRDVTIQRSTFIHLNLDSTDLAPAPCERTRPHIMSTPGTHYVGLVHAPSLYRLYRTRQHYAPVSRPGPSPYRHFALHLRVTPWIQRPYVHRMHETNTKVFVSCWCPRCLHVRSHSYSPAALARNEHIRCSFHAVIHIASVCTTTAIYKCIY